MICVLIYTELYLPIYNSEHRQSAAWHKTLGECTSLANLTGSVEQMYQNWVEFSGCNPCNSRRNIQMVPLNS